MQLLPIDSSIPQVIEALRTSPNLVIEAPPGSGKTTRIPWAILASDLAGDREVWVLEPRRLAARMAAGRVAEEHGDKPGGIVGYQIRFEEVAGKDTRLRFVTEGVLTRRLLSDPGLERVGAVVLDEFHERHLQADLAIALLRRLQQSSRPDLRIVAMSATLDTAPIAAFLGNCPSLRADAKQFEVMVEHLPQPDARPLAVQVNDAVRRLIDAGLDGDVLVFLPGAAEIRRAQDACSEVAARYDLSVVPLHGELSAEDQDRAVRPAAKRKIILSTNVAESSITVDGVVAVIDSGLARIAEHSRWSGLPVLNTGRVSKASAIQRAGRAGRTRPGRCLRLYTAQDFAARAEHESPEVQRADLSEAALEIHGAGINETSDFGWFESPAASSLEAADALLVRLGAVDSEGRVTPVGKRMLALPVHPRLARIMVEAESRGLGQEACIIVALLSERDMRARNIFNSSQEKNYRRAATHGPSDLLELMDLFGQARRVEFVPDRLRALNLEPSRVRQVDRVRRQLQRMIHAREREKPAALSGEEEEHLLISILAGYPDRVARRRDLGPGSQESVGEVALAGGGIAQFAPESIVRNSEFLVAAQADERVSQGRSARGGIYVTVASAIQPEWLIELFPDRVIESSDVEWNSLTSRVETFDRLTYDRLVLDETRKNGIRNAGTTRVLADAAKAAGLDFFVDREAVNQFVARVDFLRRSFPESNVPEINEPEVEEAFLRLCDGKLSFAELNDAVQSGKLLDELLSKLSAEHQRLLAKMTPLRLQLPNGRSVRINYEVGQNPWIASRIQDFFGMREGPAIAGGRVALVVHLLAPNQRPVQVTKDLSGFWQRHYPQLRKELGRRYPRHKWPEDPMRPAQ